MDIFSNALNPTEIITWFMEQVPSWEDNRYAYSQEFHHILWNPTVHFRIHNCPPPVPILSQLDPVHTTTSYLLKTHLTIIVLSPSGSPHWFLFPTFPQYVQGQSKKVLIICDSAPVRRCRTLSTVFLCSGDFKLYFATIHITPLSVSHELRGLEGTCV